MNRLSTEIGIDILWSWFWKISFCFYTVWLIKIGGGVFEGVSKSFKGQITIQESYGSPGKKWVLVYICALCLVYICLHLLIFFAKRWLTSVGYFATTSREGLNVESGFMNWSCFKSALAIDEELSPICLSRALDSRLPHPLCSRLLFPQYGAPVALSPPFFRITVTHRVRLTIHEQYNGKECLTERKHHPCDEKWSYIKISTEHQYIWHWHDQLFIILSS